MNKKRIYTIFILAAASIAGWLSYSILKSKSSYNVMLIVSDALRYDILECYGGDVETPNLNWLAQNGTIFENAYATSSSTMPSAISIFTGNYASSYLVTSKVNKNSETNIFYINDSERLLTEILQEKGYNVLGHFENPIAYQSNNIQGFSWFREFHKMTKEERQKVFQQIGMGNSLHFYRTLYDLENFLSLDQNIQPFFICKWFVDPHSHYDPPQKFSPPPISAEAAREREENFYRKHHVKKFNELFQEGKFSSGEITYTKALYKGEVRFIDERIGYILKGLRKNGLMEKTFIIFTSDHGELFGEHNYLGHGRYYYENLVHVPLIFYGPGIPKGKIEKTTVSHIDLMPTIKDLLGVGSKTDMQGNGYSDLFKNKKIEPRYPYFDTLLINRDKWRKFYDGLLMDGFKLISEVKKDQTSFNLFNITNDPEESENLSDTSIMVVNKMLKELITIRKTIANKLKKNLSFFKDKRQEIDYEKNRKNLESLGYL